MPDIVFQLLVIGVALAVLYGVWGGVQLLAHHRLGYRRLGCRGPLTDDLGNQVCCNTGEPCERSEDETSCGSGSGSCEAPVAEQRTRDKVAQR